MSTVMREETAKSGSLPKLLSQRQAWEYLGVSRAAWFRMRAEGVAPRPVKLPGSGIRIRRSDLDEMIARLKSN